MREHYLIERDIITRLTSGAGRRALRANKPWADYLITGLSTLSLGALLASFLPELLLALLGAAVVAALGYQRP